jgi:hypothetical protein
LFETEEVDGGANKEATTVRPQAAAAFSSIFDRLVTDAVALQASPARCIKSAIPFPLSLVPRAATASAVIVGKTSPSIVSTL